MECAKIDLSLTLLLLLLLLVLVSAPSGSANSSLIHSDSWHVHSQDPEQDLESLSIN